MYLVNVLIGALTLLTFYTLRSWYKGLEHQYKMYSLEHEAKAIRDRLGNLLNSVSNYEVERLKKTIDEFGSTVELQQAIAWFREQRVQDSKKIQKLSDRVDFLWRNSGAEQ